MVFYLSCRFKRRCATVGSLGNLHIDNSIEEEEKSIWKEEKREEKVIGKKSIEILKSCNSERNQIELRKNC